MQKSEELKISLLDIVIEGINSIKFIEEPNENRLMILTGILSERLEELFYVSATHNMSDQEYIDYLAVCEANPGLSTVERLLISLDGNHEVLGKILGDIDKYVDDFVKSIERDEKLGIGDL